MKTTVKLDYGYGKANIRDKGLSWDRCSGIDIPGIRANSSSRCKLQLPIRLMRKVNGKVYCCVCEEKVVDKLQPKLL